MSHSFSWENGHSLLICYHAKLCLHPSLGELLQLFLEGDQLKEVVRAQKQLGSLMICQQLTAKFQHPEVMMGAGAVSEES